jgi:hypothetical protein
MKVVTVFLLTLQFAALAHSFSSPSSSNRTDRVSLKMSADETINSNDDAPCTGEHPFNKLPGDPSLHLVTNVDLGDKKMEIMKGKITRRFQD